MADYFRIFMMLSSLAVISMPRNRSRWRSQVYMFSVAVAHACAYGIIIFYLVFSKKFNIMSALFVHQPLTSPQKIDSREGLF